MYKVPHSSYAVDPSPIFQPPTAITAVEDLSDGSFNFGFPDIDTGTLPDHSLDDQSAHSPNIESAAEPIRQQHSYSLRTEPVYANQRNTLILSTSQRPPHQSPTSLPPFDGGKGDEGLRHPNSPRPLVDVFCSLPSIQLIAGKLPFPVSVGYPLVWR